MSPAMIASVAIDPWLIASGAATTAMLAAFGVIRVARSSGERTRVRVARLRTPIASARSAAGDMAEPGRLSAISRRLYGGPSAERARLRLLRAGLPGRAGTFLMLRMLACGGGILAGAAVARRLMGDPVAYAAFAALGAGIALVLPGVYLRVRTSRRQRALEGQLVELCEVMASMLASGFGYLQALTNAAEQLGMPLRGELRRVLDAIRLGADIDEALQHMEERIGSADFEIVSMAIQAQRRTGGNLSEILRGVALTIRERQAFRREIVALTSLERYSAVVVAAFPLLLTGVLAMMMPGTFGRLFTDFGGRVMLASALALNLIGYLMIRRASQLEV